MNQGIIFLVEFFNRIPPSLYTELISFYEIRDCQFCSEIRSKTLALNLGHVSPTVRDVEILISKELEGGPSISVSTATTEGE